MLVTRVDPARRGLLPTRGQPRCPTSTVLPPACPARGRTCAPRRLAPTSPSGADRSPAGGEGVQLVGGDRDRYPSRCDVTRRRRYARSAVDSAEPPEVSRVPDFDRGPAADVLDTGIGWYGDPFQKAGGLELPVAEQSVLAVMSAGVRPSTLASREHASAAARAAGQQRVDRDHQRGPVRPGCARRSRAPRGAGMRTSGGLWRRRGRIVRGDD